jgi:hypothetical protein
MDDEFLPTLEDLLQADPFFAGSQLSSELRYGRGAQSMRF